DAVFGGHRQCRIGEHGQAVGARARIRAGDQVSGWQRGEEGHAVIRDRARTVQGPARTGTSGGGGRQGDTDQCRSGIHPSGTTASQGRVDQANLDRARANRDTARAAVLQAQANTQTAEINLGYTTVSAPFDGVVTARQVSVGELVGGDHTSELATIVQLDPIWVWFNLSERDVQRVRAQMAQQGVTVADLINKVPIEVGLQTETGYPHRGVLDYSSPDVNQSTGTLQVRGIFANANRALLPGYFVRVRVPLRPEQALLVPEVAVGSDQAGRYVLVVNADGIVEQRRVQLGQTTGEMRV